MAFEDDFSNYIEQIKIRLPHIQGEEATKQSLIVPLFQILGYDVWNPLEVQPEYGADFSRGAKKGQLEKVDYALKINGEPVIFVECKAVDASLATHDGQLARYFNATPSVRVGILTNGVRIKAFTDLQQPNIMDDKPWLDFDIRTPKQAEIDALKKFRKTEFTADQIIGLAEEMVYYNVLVSFIASQLLDPGEKFVRLVAEEIPSIKRIDKKVVDRLTPILRKAIQATILDHVARSFNTPNPSELSPSSVIEGQKFRANDQPNPSVTLQQAAGTKAKKLAVTVVTDQNQEVETERAPDKKFSPESPPDLQHTRCQGTFGESSFRKWNDLMQIACTQAFAKAQSCDALKAVTHAPIKKGDHSSISGYRFLSEIDISFQNVDANRAWQHALQLAQYLNIPLRVSIEWRQHEKAAFPGETGIIEWIPAQGS